MQRENDREWQWWSALQRCPFHRLKCLLYQENTIWERVFSLPLFQRGTIKANWYKPLENSNPVNKLSILALSETVVLEDEGVSGDLCKSGFPIAGGMLAYILNWSWQKRTLWRKSLFPKKTSCLFECGWVHFWQIQESKLGKYLSVQKGDSDKMQLRQLGWRLFRAWPCWKTEWLSSTNCFVSCAVWRSFLSNITWMCSCRPGVLALVVHFPFWKTGDFSIFIICVTSRGLKDSFQKTATGIPRKTGESRYSIMTCHWALQKKESNLRMAKRSSTRMEAPVEEKPDKLPGSPRLSYEKECYEIIIVPIGNYHIVRWRNEG